MTFCMVSDLVPEQENKVICERPCSQRLALACCLMSAFANRARARTGWSPTAAEFLVLERRLDEMGREAAAREAKWQGVLEETHG
eukprot:scaffold276735_cov13-Tisochrysis_lutea.AAC.2